jgi:hypothetical protein
MDRRNAGRIRDLTTRRFHFLRMCSNTLLKLRCTIGRSRRLLGKRLSRFTSSWTKCLG